MKQRKFNVTYSIITPESAEQGDFAEHGYIAENVGLAEALDALQSTRTCHVGGVESVDVTHHSGRVVAYVSNSMEYQTGECESRALHVHNVTPSTANRLVRLIKARV